MPFSSSSSSAAASRRSAPESRAIFSCTPGPTQDPSCPILTKLSSIIRIRGRRRRRSRRRSRCRIRIRSRLLRTTRDRTTKDKTATSTMYLTTATDAVDGTLLARVVWTRAQGTSGLVITPVGRRSRLLACRGAHRGITAQIRLAITETACVGRAVHGAQTSAQASCATMNNEIDER